MNTTRTPDLLKASPRLQAEPRRGRARLRSPALVAIGLGAGLACLACAPEPRPPALLLLLTVDTLRADRLGSYGSDLDLTPNLDHLAREAQLFEQAFAPTSFTLPSVSALLTGRYPEELGVRSNRAVVPTEVPILAELLARHGVRTGAVVSNFVLRRATRLDRGFEVYDDEYPQQEAIRKLPERIAAATSDAALRVLDQLGGGAKRGVFLWVHYQDPHGPYTPPAGYRESFLERERERTDGRRLLEVGRDHRGLAAIPTYQFLQGRREVAFYRAGYAGEVRYLDDEVGRLLDGVSVRGLLDDAVVAFTADHGEGLGEDDYWFAHGEYLSEPLVRVPLLLRVPGREPARRHDVASLLDLLPTFLGLHALPPPAGTRGRDLLAPQAADASSEVYLATLTASSVPRYGLVRDGYLYRTEPGGLGVRETLSPLDGTSPEGDQAARRGAMRAALRAIRRDMTAAPAGERQPVSAEDRERLRALGYVED